MPRFHIAHVPATMFLLLGTAMNMRFGWTVGADDFARGIYIATSVATVSCIAVCPGVIRECSRKGNVLGVISTTLVMLAALGWDGYTAWAFSKQQVGNSATASTDNSRQRRDAEGAVKRATDALAAVADASDQAVARSQADSLSAQLAIVDRTPGVIVNGVPCKRQRDDEVRRACAQREQIERELTAARVAVARADAKLAATTKLELAQKELDKLPTVVVDPRTTGLGQGIAEWLPVALIVLGAALIFAAPDGSPAAPGGGQPDVPAGAATAASGQRRSRKGQAGSVQAALAQRLAGTEPGHGVVVDREGWYRGSQRGLAKATGYGANVGRFNRELHEAAAAGTVEVDTSGTGTAIRLKAPA